MFTKKIKKIENISMSILYIGAGLFVLFGNNIFLFSDIQKTIIGIALVLYGAFRSIIHFLKIKENEADEEDDDE